MTAPTKPRPGEDRDPNRTGVGAGSDIALATVARLAASGPRAGPCSRRAEPDEAAARQPGIARPDLRSSAMAWDVTQTESHARLDWSRGAARRWDRSTWYLRRRPTGPPRRARDVRTGGIVSMVDDELRRPGVRHRGRLPTASVSQGHGSIVAFSSVAGCGRAGRTSCTDPRRRGWTRSPSGLGDALVGNGVEGPGRAPRLRDVEDDGGAGPGTVRHPARGGGRGRRGRPGSNEVGPAWSRCRPSSGRSSLVLGNSPRRCGVGSQATADPAVGSGHELTGFRREAERVRADRLMSVLLLLQARGRVTAAEVAARARGLRTHRSTATSRRCRWRACRSTPNRVATGDGS